MAKIRIKEGKRFKDNETGKVYSNTKAFIDAPDELIERALKAYPNGAHEKYFEYEVTQAAPTEDEPAKKKGRSKKED